MSNSGFIPISKSQWLEFQEGCRNLKFDISGERDKWERAVDRAQKALSKQVERITHPNGDIEIKRLNAGAVRKWFK